MMSYPDTFGVGTGVEGVGTVGGVGPLFDAPPATAGVGTGVPGVGTFGGVTPLPADPAIPGVGTGLAGVGTVGGVGLPLMPITKMTRRVDKIGTTENL